MSGSYQQLLQKYNQLLSLVLNSQGGGTLQSVITANDELQGSPPTNGDSIVYNGTDVVWGPGSGATLQTVIDTDNALQGIAPSTNQVIQYNGTNVVWATITSASTVSGVYTVASGDTSGTIPYGITFPTAPVVTISQLADIPGNIVGLAVVACNTTNFQWISTAGGVGKINWVATQ